MSEVTAFERQFRNNPYGSETGTLSTEAHRLAGAAGSLGLPALNALFVEFETVCKKRGGRFDRNLTARLGNISQRTREAFFEALETD